MPRPKSPQAGKRTSSPDLRWFVEARFGMFIHWGLYSMPARGEWVRHVERIKNEDYDAKYFTRFDPDLYDPRAWAKAAVAAGMKYMVITTKHHEGFALWDTKQSDYKATKTPYGKDLLKPMVEAFRAEGLKIGFYYSLLDWHHPDYTLDRIHPQRDDEAFRKQEKGRDMRKYAAYMRAQVQELLTGYGKIDVMWFDFSFTGKDGKGHEDWESEKLLALAKKLQPGMMVNNRLDLPHEADFMTPEQYQPREALTDSKGDLVVWEGCQTFAGLWGYERDAKQWKSASMLLGMLVDGVSKNGNLLLNVGPTARGELEPGALQRLEAMGDWMRLHSRAIYGCGPAPEGLVAPPDCRYTYNVKTGRLYLHIMRYPFYHIHCPGLGQRLKYAQFLNDGSEVKFITPAEHKAKLSADDNMMMPLQREDDAAVLQLPTQKPEVEIPVIELFLK